MSGRSTRDAAEPGEQSGLEDLGYIDFDGIPVWSGAKLRQSFTAVNFRTVFVRDEFPKAVPGEPESDTHSGVADFDFTGIASARFDRYCLAGLGEDGQFVLERWELVPATEASRSSAGSEPLVKTRSGRVLSKDFEKVRIFEGLLGESVIGIGFDAEERFMMALLGDDQGVFTLYKIDNAPGAVPRPVFDSIAYPELAAMGHLSRFDHNPTGSRVWYFSSADLRDDLSMMLFDEDNDGQFDGAPLIGDSEELERLGYPFVYPYWDSLNGTGF